MKAWLPLYFYFFWVVCWILWQDVHFTRLHSSADCVRWDKIAASSRPFCLAQPFRGMGPKIIIRYGTLMKQKVWVVVYVIPQTLCLVCEARAWCHGRQESVILVNMKEPLPLLFSRVSRQLVMFFHVRAPVCAQTIIWGHVLVLKRGELIFGRSHYFKSMLQ